jgi:3-oxoacyl-[acyl-carrier-protein] synthase III
MTQPEIVTRDAYVSGVQYQLGEVSHRYLDASGFQEVLTEKKLPDMPDLWGWGTFYTTDNAYELGRMAGQKALEASGIDPASVDLTVIACSYFPDADDLLYQGAAKILKDLALTRSLIEGQTLMGCATLLSALHTAAQLVRAGIHQNILVIGIDKMPKGLPRFWDYGLFSDAAAACLVSSARRGRGLRHVGSARSVQLDELLGGVRFNAKNALHVKVLGELMADTGHTVPQISRVFNNNVYLPIKSQKDQLAGFKRPQMFLDNVARTGHCFSCDSLVNFSDYAASQKLAAGDRFVFQADGNGCCAMSLLQWESE